MGTIRLPPDFNDFLRSLNDHKVEYLLIGGYAVGYHGYPRATADLDVWIGTSDANSVRCEAAVKAFGFETPELSRSLFQQGNQIIRMGRPPLRIEMHTEISGVKFEACYASRVEDVLDGIPVKIISLAHLKVNKQAGGRHQDLADLDRLP